MGLVQHPTFYLPLGDLIVQSAADAKGTSTLFRVNKSLLAFNSPVFADMFALPTTSTQELYDGAPIVRVTDTAEDLTALCSALYDISSLSLPRFDPDAPIRLTGVMRLATKYQIDTIRRRVIEILDDSWPQTYDQWRRFQSQISAMTEIRDGSKDRLVGGKRFEDCIPEPAAAIRFARDFDVPSILPFAFYTLAGISQSNNWHDRRRIAIDDERTARWEQLDIVDYRTSGRWRETLSSDVVGLAGTFGLHGDVLDDFNAADCLGYREGHCADNVGSLLDTWSAYGLLGGEALAEAASLPNPLALLEGLYNTQADWKVCEDCRDRLRKRIREEQRSVWDSITRLSRYI